LIRTKMRMAESGSRTRWRAGLFRRTLGVCVDTAGGRNACWKERVLDGAAVGMLALGRVCTLLRVATRFARGWG
jgi:hypothetical protein